MLLFYGRDQEINAKSLNYNNFPGTRKTIMEFCSQPTHWNFSHVQELFCVLVIGACQMPLAQNTTQRFLFPFGNNFRAGLDEKMRVRVVILLVFCVFGYMIAGGFIFNALEKNHERKLRETTRDYLNEFLGELAKFTNV